MLTLEVWKGLVWFGGRIYAILEPRPIFVYFILIISNQIFCRNLQDNYCMMIFHEWLRGWFFTSACNFYRGVSGWLSGWVTRWLNG